MKKRIFRTSLKRLRDLLVSEIALSIFITVLNIYGFLGTQQILLTGLFVGCVVFAGVNIYFMRNSLYRLWWNWAYYVSNFLAYFIFVLINLLVLNLNSTIYTWLFALTKVFVYTRFGISAVVSALIFHAVMLIFIPVSTIGIDNK